MVLSFNRAGARGLLAHITVFLLLVIIIIITSLLTASGAFAIPNAVQDKIADRVLGQPDFLSGVANNGGLSAYSLHYPSNIAFDPSTGRVFVSDRLNNRILSWPAFASLASHAPADLVIGQQNLASGDENAGGASAATLNKPFDLQFDSSGNLWAADLSNHRVLVYSPPFTTGMSATYVFGQPDFNTVLTNTGGLSAASLNLPSSIALDPDGDVYIVDYGNSRVLFYSQPLSSDRVADMVIGQASFTSNSPNAGGLGAGSLAGPGYIRLDHQGNLWLSDQGNNRVLVYEDPQDSSNDVIADWVIGQPDFYHNDPNIGQASAASLYEPAGISLDSHGSLYVSDFGNNRVLVYFNPLLYADGKIADHVFGQPDFTTVLSNTGGICAQSLYSPIGLAFDPAGSLYVADRENNRVLIYDQPIPNPAPLVSSLDPVNLLVDSGDTMLTVTGSGFGPDSVVRQASSDLVTTYQDELTLQANLPAAAVASAGFVPISVYNPGPGGGSSSPLTLTVNNPGPTLTGANPGSITVGDNLSLTGASFVPESRARLNGIDLTTTYIDGEHLSAIVDHSVKLESSPASLTVFNPTPGGGESAALSLLVNNPVPILVSVSPNPADLGSLLVLEGAEFVAGSTAVLNGIDLPTTYISETRLTALADPHIVLSDTNNTLLVYTPAPGGGQSATLNLTLTNPTPVLLDADPNPYTGGNLIALNGSSFVAVSIARLNGVDLPTSFVTTTQLTAGLPDLSPGMTVTLTVFTPLPGGGLSQVLVVPVENPQPVITNISPNPYDGSSLLTLTGSDFIPDSVARLEGSDLSTTYISSTQLTIPVSSDIFPDLRSVDLTVFNPAPGGGLSQPIVLFLKRYIFLPMTPR